MRWRKDTIETTIWIKLGNGIIRPLKQAAAEAPSPEEEEVQAVVWWQPASRTVAVGEEFVMEVVIETAVGVGHTPFWVIFDNRVVEILEVTEG